MTEKQYKRNLNLTAFISTSITNEDYNLINTIYDYIDRNYVINEITVTDLELATNNIITLGEFKSRKIEEIETAYKIEETAGYFDETENVTVGITDNDRNMFNQLITMLQFDTTNQITEVNFADINNISKTLSKQSFLELIVQRTGIYYMQLWNKLNLFRSNIINATTINDVDSIQWS